MSLKHVARETLALLERGTYEVDQEQFDISGSIAAAVDGTELLLPDEIATLAGRPHIGERDTTVAVTGETTQIAARRLAQRADCGHLAALNFASARNPGGGFIKGAKAQEEDLARCSALHPCLVSDAVAEYYAANRAQSSMLYLDHIIWSPAVPFFRARSRDEPEAPFAVSVITSPAPNAGQYLARVPGRADEVHHTLRRRAHQVLALAADRSVDTLVLGAWGCGVFRNDPEIVAETFGALLDGPFAGTFGHVCFAVYDRSKSQANRTAFDRRFGT